MPKIRKNLIFTHRFHQKLMIMKTVRLTSFQDNVQAHMLQDILKDQGIESMLQGELTNQVMTYLRGFEVDVLVFEKDLERAKEILKEAFPENI